MKKILLTSTFALLVCGALAAQAPAPASQAPASPPATAQPPRDAAPPTQAPAPRAAAKADSITVEGCIQRSAQAPSATPGATGTAGASGSSFVLANAMKPTGTSGAAGASAAPVAPTYRLDAEDSKLTPHVGHKVEITGTLDTASSTPPAGGGASAMASAPKLKVDNVKMIAASCTP